jgi:hypothetical protein
MTTESNYYSKVASYLLVATILFGTAASGQVRPVSKSPPGTCNTEHVYANFATADNIVAIGTIQSIDLIKLRNPKGREITCGVLGLAIKEVLYGAVSVDTPIVTPNVAYCDAGSFRVSAVTEQAWLNSGDTVIFLAVRFRSGECDYWCVSNVRIVDGYGTSVAKLYDAVLAPPLNKNVDCERPGTRTYNCNLEAVRANLGTVIE